MEAARQLRDGVDGAEDNGECQDLLSDTPSGQTGERGLCNFKHVKPSLKLSLHVPDLTCVPLPAPQLLQEFADAGRTEVHSGPTQGRLGELQKGRSC